MSQALTKLGQQKRSRSSRFGRLLAAAVILYIAAIMLFIVIY